MRSLVLNLRLFIESGRLSYIALFRWLRPTTYIASKLIMPFASILFFTFLGIEANGIGAASFFIIGNALQMTAVNGIYGVTMSIGGDRWEGTLPYLFGVPGNRLVFFFGRAFFHLLDGSFGVIFGLIFGALLFGLDFSQTNFLGLAITILIATFSTAGFGLLLGAISLMTPHVFFINNAFYFLLLVFSGANIPLDAMPVWMRSISNFLPLTRGIAAARQAMDGASFAEIMPLLGGEIAVGLIYAFLGYFVFRYIEIQARRQGTLDLA